jgi:hypothetical protein
MHNWREKRRRRKKYKEKKKKKNKRTFKMCPKMCQKMCQKVYGDFPKGERRYSNFFKFFTLRDWNEPHDLWRY